MAFDLQLIDIGKVYDNGTAAVREFSLDVTKGEFIAFLGPSGCGKTTTLRMIAGFESITSGDLLVRGQRINDLPPERRPTSMIFQNYALFPHMTVRRNVGYGLEVKGLAKAARDAKVDGILEKLGLLSIAEARTDRLSGGQRQRIALARGLVVEPDILLLDEPLGALDANLRKTIQSELKLLQRNLGITFVFVTHAQSEALTLSDRVVVMNQGRVEQISAPYDLYTRPDTDFVARFIGHNTVFDGVLAGREGEIGTVTTGHGTFSGLLNRAGTSDARVHIVIPSEAFEVFPAAAANGAALAPYHGNVLAGTVQRAEVVGRLVHISIALQSGDLVKLEGHVDKYRKPDLGVGATVTIAWNANQATVIPAAAAR